MSDIQYIGEHLLVGQLGHFFILLAFVSVLFASYSYYKSGKSDESNWLQMGRFGFITHALSVFTIMALLAYAMINKMYEYSYVQRQVSDDLPFRYLFSAFWQGQEGSFLLWMFWHSVLGLILIKTAKKWEAGVLAVLALVQGFLMSMILGIYMPFMDDEKIGSNPFALIRDAIDAPIFSNADYLSLITGQGLNPLLQNYWMTIHPPVLFLGFASVTIPFCFAMTGLARKAHREWLKPAMNWTYFSAFILGTGILMGGAWAYEALSFGGYWAWDPVENSSLVPWLVGIAGMHTHLIAKNTGRSVGSTYIYYSLAFILVLYSTFLTRSGILGDTSVHAFTEMGLESQLILFMAFFSLLGIFLYVKNRKSIPKVEKEEALYAREFWMFVGAMVLLFSGILMTISTSLPVYNKIVQLFNPDYIGQVITDQVAHHNKYQLWIGVFIGLLSSGALLLRYREFNWPSYKNKFFKHFGALALISLVLTLVINPFLETTTWHQPVLLYAALLVVLTNLDHVLLFSKNNMGALGSFFSHIGFGILVLGVLFSGLNKRHISTNAFAQKGVNSDEQLDKTILLIKDQPFPMNNYWVKYESDSLEGNLRKFDITFKEVDDNDVLVDSFVVRPSALYSNDYRSIASWNPSTKRYWHKDIFTQIAGYPAHLQDIEEARAMEDSLVYNPYDLEIGKVYEYENFDVVLVALNFDPELDDNDSIGYDMGIGLDLEFRSRDKGNKIYSAQPAVGLRNSLVYQVPKVINELGLKIRADENLFAQVFTDENNLDYNEVLLKQGESTEWRGLTIHLQGFSRTPAHRNYTAQEGDIALGAQLVVDNGQMIKHIEPIYIIRNSQQFSIKEYIPEMSLHVRFKSIDPSTEQMTFALAKDENRANEFRIEIAENVPRSDILVFEAQVFPGMNLVWSGSIMMLLGFLVSLFRRRKTPA